MKYEQDIEERNRPLSSEELDSLFPTQGYTIFEPSKKLIETPLLLDKDYYVRIEGREIISNLSKTAGLATMIANLRPDIDHADEYVRNITARSFSVVASELGIPSILPLLKAVCQSKKSWQARHTGTKIVQQILKS